MVFRDMCGVFSVEGVTEETGWCLHVCCWNFDWAVFVELGLEAGWITPRSRVSRLLPDQESVACCRS